MTQRLRISDQAAERLRQLQALFDEAFGTRPSASQIIEMMLARLPGIEVLARPPIEGWDTSPGTPVPGGGTPVPGHQSHPPAWDTSPGTPVPPRSPAPDAAPSAGTDSASCAPARCPEGVIDLSEVETLIPEGDKSPPVDELTQAWYDAAAENSGLIAGTCPPPQDVLHLLVERWREHPYTDQWLAAFAALAALGPEPVLRFHLESLRKALSPPKSDPGGTPKLLRLLEGAYQDRASPGSTDDTGTGPLWLLAAEREAEEREKEVKGKSADELLDW